jgi:hypothetical protein
MDEVYSSGVVGFCVKDVERSNGESRQVDRFRVKPIDKHVQDVIDPRSSRTADLYALIGGKGTDRRIEIALSYLRTESYVRG